MTRHLGTALLVLTVVLAGCASFAPQPIESVPFKERLQTQEKNGIRVSTTVLSREESQQAFGLDLTEKQVQPVWVRIENRTDVPFVFMLHGLDPNYFSAREVAYMFHERLRGKYNDRIDAYFGQYAMNPLVFPHETTEGFVFSNLKLGTKEVRVKLYGPARWEVFEFFVPVPGFQADYHEVDWDALLSQEFTDYEDEASFAEALRALPCCTTRKDGTGKGDPLNLVLIGGPEDVANALRRSGWDETETLSRGAAWRTFKAFFGGTYKYSPMSPLYVFGRPQDAGFQKARGTIHQRNHLRLWLSPLKFRGKNVFLGTITRDIGVYFTTKTWNLTTHAIDPDVDEARHYLREDFQGSQSIERWGNVSGVGKATPAQPHRNLMDAPWWTQGLRLVMEVSDEPVPLEEQRFFFWEWNLPEGIDQEEFNRRLRELVTEHGGRL